VGLLEWWSIPRKAWIIILAELCVIVGLSGSIASVYFNDLYFQAYVNSLAPILVPVVSVGFGIASASTATLFYFRMKNLTHAGETTGEEDAKPRGQRHAARKIPPTDAGNGKSVTGTIVQGSRLRPLMPTGTRPSRGSASPSADQKDSSSP
jgi:hypothetical protein